MRLPFGSVRWSSLLALASASVVAASTAAPQSAEDVLWRDPGPVAGLDLRAGPMPADAPRPPFTFVEEELTGHSPKIVVTDSAGRRFGVKFGDEVHAEVFATRLVWACGFQVEPTYYVADGRIDGVHGLGRSARFVAADGAFRSARFKGPHDHWKKLAAWRWDQNPFVGTRELAGLKILTMLLANWDDKDARDAEREPNTEILLERATGRRLFAVTDWGTTLGQWGGQTPGTRWNCTQYAAQSSRLILGVEGRTVRWGVDRFAEPISEGLTVDDVAWLLTRLGKITDRQLRGALDAAGATSSQASCYVRAVRDRTERLRSATRR